MSSSKANSAALCLLAMLPACCLAEYELNCPESVEYEVTVSRPASDWNAGFRPGAAPLSPPATIKRQASYQEAVLYFEGNVDDAVELKGFTGRKYKGAYARIIELDAERRYSVMCLYSDGLVQWKELPPRLKRCITVEKKGTSPHRAFCE